MFGVGGFEMSDFITGLELACIAEVMNVINGGLDDLLRISTQAALSGRRGLARRTLVESSQKLRDEVRTST